MEAVKLKERQPAIYPQPKDQITLRSVNSAETIQTEDHKPGLYARYMKRPLDVALVLISLPVVVPLIALMVIAVAIEGGKPIYKQQRIGRGGRIYTILKLRTMVRDADAALERYLASDPAICEEWETLQKLRHDPRITRVGRILRRTSMDELPQIWNVLLGDMSLIGPRPMMPSQQVMYINDSYYSLRPGITGLWQVSRRNEGSFGERAAIDRQYARNLSFRRDLKILFDTLVVVFRQTGV